MRSWQGRATLGLDKGGSLLRGNYGVEAFSSGAQLDASSLPLALAIGCFAFGVHASEPSDRRQEALAIYKELVEINTVTATGDTSVAADAMAARLRAAGFSDEDVRVFKPAPRKGNLVVRLRGNGAQVYAPMARMSEWLSNL